MHLSLEGLVQNSITWVILNVLPAGVAMSEIVSWSRKTNRSTEPRIILQNSRTALYCFSSLTAAVVVIPLLCPMLSFFSYTWERIRYDASQQPVVMATMPNVMHFSRRQRRSLFSLPKGVQLWRHRYEDRSFLARKKSRSRLLTEQSNLIMK